MMMIVEVFTAIGVTIFTNICIEVIKHICETSKCKLKIAVNDETESKAEMEPIKTIYDEDLKNLRN